MDFFLPVNHLWLPVAAVALDLLLGDPHSWPHPVNLQGRVFTLLQAPLLEARRFLRLSGALALLAALAVTALVICFALNIPGVPCFILCLIAVYLCFAGLALGCLLREGAKACRAIDAVPGDAVTGPEAGNSDNPDNSGNLGDAPQVAQEPSGSARAESVESPELLEARRAVSMLVSRDVSRLDKTSLYRTLAETLSENFTDAFVAPFFWLLAGGPLALWLYKCVSTADSRWGYMHEPWTLRGRAGARLDDVLAYIPARLSALFLYWSMYPRVASGGSGVSWPGWKILRQDAQKMESPNAGWSMAAVAWLHGAFMGGPAVYAGKVKQKPVLGPAGNWDGVKIDALLRHLRRAGLLVTGVLTAILALASVLVN
ncbi:cobalamin biosynthesis protein [Desulfovibrio sp. OttesenSCG-928-C06]|nr:cobalamin biosynthesis protein [Desulfovibrio sp. OttesenSCG-928-C06]